MIIEWQSHYNGKAYFKFSIVLNRLQWHHIYLNQSNKEITSNKGKLYWRKFLQICNFWHFLKILLFWKKLILKSVSHCEVSESFLLVKYSTYIPVVDIERSYITRPSISAFSDWRLVTRWTSVEPSFAVSYKYLEIQDIFCLTHICLR